MPAWSRRWRPVQFPDLLVAVDGLTRFSWILLNRPPRSEFELITVYGALVALGSGLSASEVVRMVAGIDADSIGQMMLRIETDGQLRAASDAVVRHLQSYPISGFWGQGVRGSADMMSLEATRRLWSARVDPRRRSYAVGTYTHVLDRWGIVYDQPILLNRRQAGAAIEGVRRQQCADVTRLAVDTHGFTHFAMALAKLVGLDLCPRLASLKSRKLYLPRGLSVPAELAPIVTETISRRAIARGWDGLLRLAASVQGGWCSAGYVLDRFGSAARGGAVYEAGVALGKLLRSLYLCDYWSNRDFRSEILDLLNQGESVHSLQRAIHSGVIAATRGRTADEFAAVSGALTLLTNIVMLWNTSRMQAVLDQKRSAYPEHALSRIAPVAFAHINMRGVFKFDLGKHRVDLIGDRHALRPCRQGR